MISFFDLGAQQAEIKSNIDKNIAKVLAHGKYILGPEVTMLESHLCQYTGAKYAITCANGTDALQIALQAIGVGPGDEVITPAFSYIAAAEAIAFLGAKPIFVDIERQTYNLKVEEIRNKISYKTKAIVPVSLFGQPANYKIINTIAKEYNITVIEDAAQSFGASREQTRSCNLTKIACTSFFPTKPLGCYGDGGAIFTSDDKLAHDLRQISRHGQGKKYEHLVIGVNSRLDTIQAAILLAKLDVLDGERDARERLAKQYVKSLEQLPQIQLPFVEEQCSSAWAQFSILVPDRIALTNFLNSSGIPTMVHYPTTLPKQPALLNPHAHCPNAEYVAKHVLSLPIHSYLTTDEQTKIITAILKYFEK